MYSAENVETYGTPFTTAKGNVFPLQARLWPRGWVEVQLYSSMTAPL